MHPPESLSDDTEYDHTSTPSVNSSSSSYDPVDDMFGDSGSESPLQGLDGAETNDRSEISLDARRLQAQYNTVGYREGINAGKAETIQAGFDSGFALGANIGLRAGQVLGLLEGISAALAEVGPSDESVYAEDLLAQAIADLKPESLFTSQFWAPDGTFTYAVTASHDDGKIVHQDVADQHPLISKWSRIVSREAEKWDLDRAPPIFASDNQSFARQDTDATAAVPDVSSSKSATASRVAIEW
ncbi:hypothetical protein GGR50DRAFT_514793 [Xylaria sp. CBS 124048]|nr:hypothetical protein GGR50DRAFT_514793 [Xylaria sp. CBS 124048]